MNPRSNERPPDTPNDDDAAKPDYDKLPEAAKRALAEAEERRRRAEDVERAKEEGGRDGPDPVRYGDWENGGIASDF